MIKWELKKVLSYAMKRYCLILCYLFSMKKNTKSFLLSLLFLSFLYLCSEFGVATNSFLSLNTSHKIGRGTYGDEFKATNWRRIYRPKWEPSFTVAYSIQKCIGDLIRYLTMLDVLLSTKNL